jgi:ATP-dependent DNA helicase RecG
MAQILDREIQFLPGIGPKRAELLGKELNIATFRDLIYTFPFRYIDRSKIYSINEIDTSMAYIQLRGKISKISIVGEKRGKRMIATLSDGTGNIDMIFFQGIKWMEQKLATNKEYIVFGKPSIFNDTYNLVHPEIDPVGENIMNYGSSMMGVYSSTEKLRSNGIGNKTFTKLEMNLVSKFLDFIPESLPEHIIQKHHLCPLKFALKNIHFPTDLQSLGKAQIRLKFEELFYLQLSLLKQKKVRMRESVGVLMPKVGNYFNRSFANIPFELTDAQKRVIKEIRADMMSGKQMNRLLQGDVGSGKTMVAILTALLSADNGYQSCIMAPTEVLANQHYSGVFKTIEGSGIKVALLTGSTKAKERKEIHKGLLDGSIHILFGTHAVIEDTVQFKNLGFVVIDEQHRFGVNQRAKLRMKSQVTPHILVMTATPIPRTLAMTLYGDLDVSVLDELPPGRKPVQTLHITESKRDRMYAFLKDEIAKGRQIFIVYPLIKESETMDYKNLEEGYETITRVFPRPQYITTVVHGQLKSDDKSYDMNLFAQGKAHIMVATSAIEVGVDVPNASVMVIESAERFGLSQLHQLRGRVGRGAERSYCILMTAYKLSKESRQRIELMCSTNDGFELAEADMRMRGPGDIEGTQQSGLAIDLHISDLAKDTQILIMARDAAQAILDEDPLLQKQENSILVSQLRSIRGSGAAEEVDYSKIS